MRKIYILFTISLLSSLSLIAQNAKTKKADKQFDRFQYVKAAENYLSIVDSGEADTYVYTRLADCYYNVFNTTEAEKWYAKALADSNDSEVIYKYSQMLKANSKYKESNTWMKKFAAQNPTDVRAMSFMENPDYLPKILEKGKKFNVQSMDFNSEVSDFGGTFHDNKLYIVSARNSARKTYSWNNQPYLDILEVPVRTDGTYGDAFLLNDKINTKYHEGPVTFSPDGNTMYFSRESFFEKRFVKDSVRNDKYGVLNLFKATKTEGTWGNVESLPFNSANYNTDHPALSSDGKTLYFTSDMPGGFGMSDIYKVTVNSDGSFGEPENLGQKVNTESREMFPFSAEDGTLYFASDGHLGLGGLDVFFTKEVDGKMAPVRNLGVPVNSGADDFALVMNSKDEGFVSSNRMGGKGSDDIYAVKKLQPLCDVLILPSVTDAKTGNAIQGASVTLADADGNVINTKTTNAEGKTEFMVECDTETELQVTMNDYESKKVRVAGSADEEVAVSVMLDPIEKIIQPERIVLNPIYFDFDKSNITSQAAFELDKLVQVMSKYPNMVIRATSHTDSRGSDSYNQRLSERRASSTVQYVISKGIDASRISAQGRGETEPVYNCGSNCSEDEHQMNRRSQFLIVSGGPQAQ
jgi:outer membrane protein OmpA-like peptidoglycan-associated protein/tetratricopeptide (TPR) repeat protein